MLRRLLCVLARSATWRCVQCDTYNADSDARCICCGS